MGTTTNNFCDKKAGNPSSKCCRCDPKPTSIDPTELCKNGCEYYQKRYDDYKARHTCPGCAKHRNPPDYYLNYGKKYCEKFTHETSPKLSPKGKRWLNETRCNLQTKMEEIVQESPELEKDQKALRKAAFDSHPKAYLDAGLADLSVDDLVKIGITPDPSEWLSLDTWKQAVEVGKVVIPEKYNEWSQQVQKKCEELKQALSDRYEESKRALSEYYEELQRKLKEYFEKSSPK